MDKAVIERVFSRPSASDLEKMRLERELSLAKEKAEPPKIVAPTDGFAQGLQRRAMGGGRLAQPREDRYEFYAVSSPRNGQQRWKTYKFSERYLMSMATDELISTLADISPEVDKALYDWTIFCNPGRDLKASPPAAREAILEWISHMDKVRYGGFDAILNQMYSCLFLQGAIFTELIIAPELDRAIDIAVMEPSVAQFRKIPFPDRGKDWQLGQWQGSKWVPLDDETIRFVPLRNEVNNPYGRGLITSSIIPSVFMITFLQELREVVRYQGYPRLDVKIITEVVRENAPDHIIGDPEAEEAYLNMIFDQVERTMANLQPRDVYVHPDEVEVNSPITAVSSNVMEGFKVLIDHHCQSIIRGLKTLPVLQGYQGDNSPKDTRAIREWEIFMSNIKSAQATARHVLNHYGRIAAEVKGIAVDHVDFQFRELRDSEALRYAEVDKQNLMNLKLKYELIEMGVPEDEIVKVLQSGMRFYDMTE